MSQVIRLYIERESVGIFHHVSYDIEVIKRHAKHVKLSPKERQKIEIEEGVHVPHTIDTFDHTVVSASDQNPLLLQRITFNHMSSKLEVTIIHTNSTQRKKDFNKYFAATMHPLIQDVFSMDTDDFLLVRSSFHLGRRCHIWNNYKE